MIVLYTIVDGLWTSLFAMSVVFSVLVILSLVISLFSRFVPAQQPAPVSVKPSLESDEEELLVAKIVAACLFQKGDGENVNIKSIRRVK